MTEEPLNDDNDNKESYGRRCGGQRKLQMCPLVVEEATNLSLDDDVTCTLKQQWRRELRTRAIAVGALYLSVDGRGSVKAIR